MERMQNLEDLEMAVKNLPEEEYRRFRRWFLKTAWERWDMQIVEDSKTGKLEFLVKEAQDAKKKQRLRDL